MKRIFIKLLLSWDERVSECSDLPNIGFVDKNEQNRFLKKYFNVWKQCILKNATDILSEQPPI